MLFSPLFSDCITGFLPIFRPEAFSWDQVVKMSPVERLDHAFTFAKNQLAIEKLLDPEGTVFICCATCFLAKVFTSVNVFQIMFHSNHICLLLGFYDIHQNKLVYNYIVEAKQLMEIFIANL